jgi:poly(glycerol-phosphate) alpha-glucosyltransferase
MKTVCIMGSVSRANGGVFEAERRLQQSIHAAGAEVSVVGLRDAETEADRPAWAPLHPLALPIQGPFAFGYAPGFERALEQTSAEIGYLAGLWRYPSLAAHRWSRRGKKPLLVAPHGMLDRWALRNSGWKKKIASSLFQDAQLRESACLRALTAAEAVSIGEYGLANPVCVVPNGIDLPSPGVSELFPGRRVLLYLGRIHPKKGLAHLLTAWSSLPSAAGDWLLAISGWDQGGHEAELKRQASQLGIKWANGRSAVEDGTSLVFLGPQFGADKEACYRGCNAFILPSFSEGLPMVVLEAWAYGKPVLMTPHCNLPEGFTAGAALPLEPAPENIQQQLASFMGQSPADLRAMGENGRRLVEQRFAWPRVASDMISVYQWVLGRGPKPPCVTDSSA